LTEYVWPHLGKYDLIDGRGPQLEKHQALKSIKRGLRRTDAFEKYTKFAIVRHPFTRFASLYQGHRGPESAPELIEKLHAGGKDSGIWAFYWSAQRWLCDGDRYENLLADRVFRIEDGTEQIKIFLLKQGIPLSAFPHVNRGTHTKKSKAYYDGMEALCGDVMGQFRELYAWDYGRFQYG